MPVESGKLPSGINVRALASPALALRRHYCRHVRFLVSVVGLPLFQWLTAGRLRLTEEMNNDIIFFASAIAVFTASLWV